MSSLCRNISPARKNGSRVTPSSQAVKNSCLTGKFGRKECSTTREFNTAEMRSKHENERLLFSFQWLLPVCPLPLFSCSISPLSFFFLSPSFLSDLFSISFFFVLLISPPRSPPIITHSPHFPRFAFPFVATQFPRRCSMNTATCDLTYWLGKYISIMGSLVMGEVRGCCLARHISIHFSSSARWQVWPSVALMGSVSRQMPIEGPKVRLDGGRFERPPRRLPLPLGRHHRKPRTRGRCHMRCKSSLLHLLFLVLTHREPAGGWNFVKII